MGQISSQDVSLRVYRQHTHSTRITLLNQILKIYMIGFSICLILYVMLQKNLSHLQNNLQLNK